MDRQAQRQKNAGPIETLKDGIVHAIEGTGDVTGAVVGTISKTVAKTIEDLGGVATSLMHATAEVVQGAVEAVMDVGGDRGAAAKGIVIGVLRGSKEAGVAN